MSYGYTTVDDMTVHQHEEETMIFLCGLCTLNRKKGCYKNDGTFIKTLILKDSYSSTPLNKESLYKETPTSKTIEPQKQIFLRTRAFVSSLYEVLRTLFQCVLFLESANYWKNYLKSFFVKFYSRLFRPIALSCIICWLGTIEFSHFRRISKILILKRCSETHVDRNF